MVSQGMITMSHVLICQYLNHVYYCDRDDDSLIGKVGMCAKLIGILCN